MIDPPRPEAVQAVADAKRGGIRTIMITGDHKVTASAIARQLGIFRDGDEAVSGVELDGMTDTELDERLPRISDRKSTRLNSSHSAKSRMPSSA